MTASPSPQRLDALTGIRGIAAWAVVIYHIRQSLSTIVPEGVIAVAGKGYLAVDLFFVLSGFVLWYNYADRLLDGTKEERLTFMWRRIARIWPLHIFILAMFVAYAILLGLTGRETADYPIAQLPLHVLLVQNWGLTSDLAWNDPAWSISTEFAAYLVFPLIVIAAPWDRLPSAALLAIVLGLAAFIAGMFGAHGKVELGDLIAKLGLWRCLAEFWMGNIACILWLRWRNRPHAASLVALALPVLLGAALLTRLPETALVPLSFFALILAVALSTGAASRLFAARPFVFLGDISYSTYLLHFLLFILFKQLFVGESRQIGWVSLAGFLALLFGASVALYYGIEKPAQRRFNRLQPKPRKAALAD